MLGLFVVCVSWFGGYLGLRCLWLVGLFCCVIGIVVCVWLIVLF